MTPYAFFLKHGATSWNPATETQQQGRRRTAREYAAAEAWLSQQVHTIAWEDEPDKDLSWLEKKKHRGRVTLCCLVKVWADGEMYTQSLGNIDMGGIYEKGDEKYDPADPYKRVVVAELAMELRHEIESAVA